MKEAELMETQRLEEARARKNDEIDRRNLQMRTAKTQLVATERRFMARAFAKDFLKTFKRDTLKIMVDVGTLRKPKDLSEGQIFVPQLYGQIKSDMQTFIDHQDQLDEVVGQSMSQLAHAHK